MDDVIINYIRKMYNLMIGDCMVEVIKMEIGFVEVFEEFDKMEICGCDLLIGLLKIIEIIGKEIFNVLCDIVFMIVEVVKSIFEKILFEFVVDIMDRGIVLIGGGVFFCNLDKVISEEMKMLVFIVEDLFDCVVIGIGKVLEYIYFFKGKIR